MSDVTHANEDILVNLSAESSKVNLQFFSIEPAVALRVTLKRGDATNQLALNYRESPLSSGDMP